MDAETAITTVQTYGGKIVFTGTPRAIELVREVAARNLLAWYERPGLPLTRDEDAPPDGSGME